MINPQDDQAGTYLGYQLLNLRVLDLQQAAGKSGLGPVAHTANHC